MRINGFSGTNMQSGTMGMAQGNDSVSKNIQNQIANAKQKLQDLSSNEEMSLEDKMKKRQEIQQEICHRMVIHLFQKCLIFHRQILLLRHQRGIKSVLPFLIAFQKEIGRASCRERVSG